MYTSQDKLKWFKGKLEQGCMFCGTCGKEVTTTSKPCQHVPRCYVAGTGREPEMLTSNYKLWDDMLYTQTVGEELLMYSDEEIMSLPLFDVLIVKETIALADYWLPIHKYKSSGLGYIGGFTINPERFCLS